MYLTGKEKFFIVFLNLSCLFFYNSSFSQFAPGPPDINSTAIYKNDTQFSFWANDVEIERGWQNISDTTVGKASIGIPSNAIGKANNKLVSLGDAGKAILQFPFAIYNVDGFDFAVFENGFGQNGSETNEYFLEFAFIEVSMDGINFIPFESTSNIDTTSQKGSFETTNCTQVNNLAGKYPINYGTPFDLEELGLDSIIAIRVTDVVGSIDTNFASYDSQGNIINDPFPTAFTSGGFDLNAIGALNQPNEDTTIINDSTETSIASILENEFKIYPNPVQENGYLHIESKQAKNLVEIYSLIGERIYFEVFESATNISTSNMTKGFYLLRINEKFSQKIIVR